MQSEIFAAISSGEAPAVERILATAPDEARRRNADGVSAIMFAAYTGQREIVSLIADRAGELGIFEATATGRVDDIRRMLESDRDLVEAHSVDGFTALHFAAFFGEPEIARLLIMGGAEVNAVARNGMRVQPLHSALARGDRAVAKALLEAGADANGQQQGGWTPLHEAARRGDRDLGELLLRHGARIDITNDDGLTPANIAANAGHAEISEMLGG